jgi:hypothetical protein
MSATGPTTGGRGGARRLWRLVTWVTSLDQLVVVLNPFRQPQQASQGDYGGVRRFL